MAKSNPLFVDSTKLHGDRIDTQIELNNILLYDGELATVIIKGQQGPLERVPMQAGDNFSYNAQVWLGHQEAITFQFVIEKDGRPFLRSTARPARAQYAIIEIWEPVVEDICRPLSVEPENTVTALSSQPLPATAPRPLSYTSGLGSLIEKWGL